MFNVSLDIHQNASFNQSFVWKTGVDQTPVNLTGCSAVMEIRDSKDTLILTLSTLNGKIVLGTTDGKVEIKLSKTDTSSLVEGNYSYDLMIDFTNGDRKKLLEGLVSVQPSVTKV